ncbi:MAG: NAD(P)-dependent oxidoreductase [Candidatus Marinimicrobia bacterium]|nr:NAD(P)-dependent oxidoreductase [Candidatus Neomarinimicrobiota bacterium]
MNNKKRILITGASGTVGTALLKQLCSNNKYEEITVFDIDTRRTRRCFTRYKKHITCVFGDISKSGDIDAACRDQDIVIHLAAVIPPLADDMPELAHRVNVHGTQNLITALERYSPSAFICYASSISVYGDRLKDPNIRVGDPLHCSIGDYYAETKIAAEKLIQTSALNWSIFRLTAIMGVQNHKISKIMFHMPLNTSIEIATPEDTARAFYHMINKISLLSGKIFNLSGGPVCRITYNDFLTRSFTLFGLGKLNFPRNAFAGKNFHCGYYVDGNELENILHFRRDTIESYFTKVKKSISWIQRDCTYLVSGIIKHRLLLQSEPLNAIKMRNSMMIRRFFGAQFMKRSLPLQNKP